jgi:acyl-CoA dehydrogenase
VLERDMQGYEVSRKLEKMGWHSSDTGELSFTDVEVPAENLLGEENRGFHLIMANFAWERLSMSLAAVGAMRRLIETTASYALERRGVRPADRALLIDSPQGRRDGDRARGVALAHLPGPPHAAGRSPIREVTMAKLLSQRACLEVADECLQIRGGYGYMREYGIERAVRDARLGPIGGGTDEVMREILGRQMGL